MTHSRTSVRLKGRRDVEGVIPSEANGRVEESVGSLLEALARKPTPAIAVWISLKRDGRFYLRLSALSAGELPDGWVVLEPQASRPERVGGLYSLLL